LFCRGLQLDADADAEPQLCNAPECVT